MPARSAPSQRRLEKIYVNNIGRIQKARRMLRLKIDGDWGIVAGALASREGAYQFALAKSLRWPERRLAKLIKDFRRFQKSIVLPTERLNKVRARTIYSSIRHTIEREVDGLADTIEKRQNDIDALVVQLDALKRRCAESE